MFLSSMTLTGTDLNFTVGQKEDKKPLRRVSSLSALETNLY